MEAVIFDMDGVIFDSERLVIDMWKVVAEKYGIAGVEKVCKECLGTNSGASREIFLRHYGEQFPYERYKQEMSEMFHSHAANGNLPKKPGIEELLQYLHEEGIKVGLASSTREAVVKKELEEGGLLSYFDKVICGDMVKKSKPEPDIFLEACHQLNVNPQKSYVIEDSYNGIRAAYAAGAHPIMVPDLAEPTEEMERKAECIFPSLWEVKKYFEQIKK